MLEPDWYKLEVNIVIKPEVKPKVTFFFSTERNVSTCSVLAATCEFRDRVFKRKINANLIPEEQTIPKEISANCPVISYFTVQFETDSDLETALKSLIE